MTRSARVSFDWADGTYAFRLAIAQLEELQEKCDAGPPVIMRRLVNDDWRIQDIRETIRLGLIGGGTKAADALVLVRRYVDPVPLAENLLPAQAILSAAIVGVPDETIKKSPGATQAAASSHPSPTGSSDSPPSTEPQPSGVSPTNP